jgi:hypothetical protein
MFNSHVEELLSRQNVHDTKVQVQDITRRSVLLLRIARQVVQQPPTGKDSTALVPLNWFGASAIRKLHSIVSSSLTRTIISQTKSLFEERQWSSSFPAESLWDGTPPLPSQCSSLIARFLHDTVQAMRSVGEDIWTPSAVKTLKTASSDGLWEILEPLLDGRTIIHHEIAHSTSPEPAPENTSQHSSEPPNQAILKEKESVAEPDQAVISDTAVRVAHGDSPNAPLAPMIGNRNTNRTITRGWAIQVLFDALYLDEALQRRHQRGCTNGVSLTAKIDGVFGTDLHMDEELRIRLEGSASEYWKKTALLFSLLN